MGVFSHGHLRLESLPDLPPTWVLTVTGKRNKTREVPLNEEVVRWLASHGKEFMHADQRRCCINRKSGAI